MLGALLLAGGILLGQADAPSSDELSLQVRRLVRQLDAPTLADREAAEEKLLQLGPGILGLLPEEPERISAEVAERVRRIRQKLQRTLAESAGQASRVTLQGDALLLSKIFAALQQQTGNKIVYRPLGDQAEEPKLKVDFQKTPFWQALDQVLDKAELNVYPHPGQRAIQVVPWTEPDLRRADRASYSGPFRFEPVMIQTLRSLRRRDNGSLRLMLEVSWEPRLAPVTLQQRMADIEAFDENGNPMPVDEPEAVREVPVTPDSTAVQLDIPLVLPPRDVKKIARLKGSLTALLPSKLETFRFENLEEAKNVPQRMAGVTVVLEQVRKRGALWEIRIRVRFDEAGGALESHRTWIYENEVCLETPDGQSITQFSSEHSVPSKNEVGSAYLFNVDGPLTGYVLLYKTPAMILSTSFDYEFREIELP